MILFRADGNKKIGSGHLMRCLSIADAMKEMGIQSIFATADDSMSELLRNRGYENIILHTDYYDMDGESGEYDDCDDESEYDLDDYGEAGPETEGFYDDYGQDDSDHNAAEPSFEADGYEDEPEDDDVIQDHENETETDSAGYPGTERKGQ